MCQEATESSMTTAEKMHWRIAEGQNGGASTEMQAQRGGEGVLSAEPHTMPPGLPSPSLSCS